jgi:hypothetical protein
MVETDRELIEDLGIVFFFFFFSLGSFFFLPAKMSLSLERHAEFGNDDDVNSRDSVDRRSLHSSNDGVDDNELDGVDSNDIYSLLAAWTHPDARRVENSPEDEVEDVDPGADDEDDVCRWRVDWDQYDIVLEQCGDETTVPPAVLAACVPREDDSDVESEEIEPAERHQYLAALFCLARQDGKRNVLRYMMRFMPNFVVSRRATIALVEALMDDACASGRPSRVQTVLAAQQGTVPAYELLSMERLVALVSAGASGASVAKLIDKTLHSTSVVPELLVRLARCGLDAPLRRLLLCHSNVCWLDLFAAAATSRSSKVVRVVCDSAIRCCTSSTPLGSFISRGHWSEETPLDTACGAVLLQRILDAKGGSRYFVDNSRQYLLDAVADKLLRFQGSRALREALVGLLRRVMADPDERLLPRRAPFSVDVIVLVLGRPAMRENHCAALRAWLRDVGDNLVGDHCAEADCELLLGHTERLGAEAAPLLLGSLFASWLARSRALALRCAQHRYFEGNLPERTPLHFLTIAERSAVSDGVGERTELLRAVFGNDRALTSMSAQLVPLLPVLAGALCPTHELLVVDAVQSNEALRRAITPDIAVAILAVALSRAAPLRTPLTQRLAWLRCEPVLAAATHTGGALAQLVEREQAAHARLRVVHSDDHRHFHE